MVNQLQMLNFARDLNQLISDYSNSLYRSCLYNIPDERLPFYRLEYEVRYKSQQDQLPNKECAEYYARRFLENFIASQSPHGLQGRLDTRCQQQSSLVTVRIHPVAVVSMDGRQVETNSLYTRHL